MRASDYIACLDFPCADLDHGRYTIPGLAFDPGRVRIAMIAEAPAPDPADGFAAGSDSFYMQTTRQAFQDAGLEVASLEEILAQGIYLTTAVKCAKTAYAIRAGSVRNCSFLLERELALLPNLVGILCMGDVAIRAVNEITRRTSGARVIPSGSTYKIRGGDYRWGEIRIWPSYLQTGKSYLIEKSKQRMIADDLRAALGLLG
ncbi:MAG: uracil-DNA glycosylase family protein [Anaerolineae bacterium]|nr:uracil-DNA glycosylase family protein [Anaerolineae bacterium]